MRKYHAIVYVNSYVSARKNALSNREYTMAIVSRYTVPLHFYTVGG